MTDDEIIQEAIEGKRAQLNSLKEAKALLDFEITDGYIHDGEVVVCMKLRLFKTPPFVELGLTPSREE